MDWPLENTGLSDSDLANVFRYEPMETTVVQWLTTDKKPILWFNATAGDWKIWLHKHLPSIERDSGLVLILARRAGEDNSLLQQILADDASFGQLSPTERNIKHDFNEKHRSYSLPLDEALVASLVGKGKRQTNARIRKYKSGSREVRQVPFSQDTFKEICNKFYVHTSISRVINRADVPIFSRAEVNMGSNGDEQPAIVYNCRSSNTWKDDLALSATYFPQSKLTFGIFFGCTVAIEHQILNRIVNAKQNVFYPLILPGIFAELERSRMADVVESTIDEIEGAIFELDSGIATKESSSDDNFSGTRYTRRTVWLNTTFLRSRLLIWRTQLEKMIEHVDQLSLTISSFSDELNRVDEDFTSKQRYDVETQSQIKRTGVLIKDRLRALLEDYDGMIEECSMRVAGMTIATQWAQGDTNVDIATSTSQDSSQMRSISLVTMVFLPGTFFATLFSMTFFNWSSSPDNGNGIVSSYIWLYFVLTGIFTIITLGAWWYFLVYRQKTRHDVLKKWVWCC